MLRDVAWTLILNVKSEEMGLWRFVIMSRRVYFLWTKMLWLQNGGRIVGGCGILIYICEK